MNYDSWLKTEFQDRSRPSIYKTSKKKEYPCSESNTSYMGLVRQNPWTPTKRRGPIAAEAASPGPAVVALPSFIGTG